MSQAIGSVQGHRNEHQVMLYALSTCVWCRRTRQFLESNGVTFDYIYVDLLEGKEREDVLTKVRRWNPFASFPTLVVDDARCVVGARLDEIKEVLDL
jgi:glutaredoxin-like protein NrdH